MEKEDKVYNTGNSKCAKIPSKDYKWESGIKDKINLKENKVTTKREM